MAQVWELFVETLIDLAAGQLVGLGHERIHAAVSQSGCDGLIDASQQSLVALGNADSRAFHVIGDIQSDAQLGIVDLVALGNGGLNERAIQLASQQLGNDVGDLGQRNDGGVGVFSLARSIWMEPVWAPI